MNVGCGVPCTIEDINGKAVEQQTEIPDPLLQEFKKTFMGRSKDILNSLNKTKDELCSLIDKKNLTKKDQERMKSLLSRYITEIRCNMPFFINQYKEETANVVQRARAEIDAALQGSVIRAGIEEERKRMAERMRGKCYMSDNGKQRISEYMRNRVVSTETRNKIRASVLGENNPNWGKRGEETSVYGRHHTEEFKKRHSERMKGENNPMYGRPSPNKGKTMSEEQKQKISRALKGRVLQKTILRGKAHPMYGKKQSEETKLKRSNSLRGRKHSPETIEKLRQAALLREERKRLLK